MPQHKSCIDILVDLHTELESAGKRDLTAEQFQYEVKERLETRCQGLLTFGVKIYRGELAATMLSATLIISTIAATTAQPREIDAQCLLRSCISLRIKKVLFI